MAKNKKPQLEGEFKHNTSIGTDGELLFDAPIEIKDNADSQTTASAGMTAGR